MVFLKGLRKMKKILPSIAVITLIAFVLLLLVAIAAYPMHIGEPSWYHVARVDCLVAASACGLVSFVSAIASAHF